MENGHCLMELFWGPYSIHIGATSGEPQLTRRSRRRTVYTT